MNIFITLIIIASLTGCASLPKPAAQSVAGKSAQTVGKSEAAPTGSASKKSGGYYLDDGPDAIPPSNLDTIPDAVPKIEPLHHNANLPYTALGQTYTPETQLVPYHETGLASWYGRRFNGKRTASGERYDMYAMTAAHPTLPIPSYAQVKSLSNGKTIIVRINDRGPFHYHRIIDLSYTAAHKLGIIQGGSGMVEVTALTPAEISKGRDLDASASGIFLQLGSFDSHGNAEKLLAEATTKLNKSSAALVIINQNNRYHVALGPYTDEDSANQAAHEIKNRMNLKPVRIVLK